MLVLTISCAIFIFSIVVIIFSKKGIENDLIRKRLNEISMIDELHLDEELKKSFAKRFVIPYVLWLKKLITPKKKKNSKITDEKLQKDLEAAGFKITTSDFLTIKYVIIAISFALSLVLITVMKNIVLSLFISIFIIILGILIPRYLVQMKITMRTSSIKNQIPDVMDILSVSLEAGLGFDSALIKISSRINGPFVDELLILYREIQLGKPRREALRSLADRNSVEEIKTFASSIIQAETLGISINKVLKVQAEQLRLGRKQAAEEKGKKAPIKIMIPLVLFIFPVIFIIILGPTAITLMEQFL